MRKIEDKQEKINLCYFILKVKGRWEDDYHSYCRRTKDMTYEEVMKKGFKNELC